MNHTTPQPLIDPVCGMTVTESSGHTLQHEGRTYYFCSAGCQRKFAAHPAQYTASAATSHTRAASTASTRSGRHDLHLPDAPRGAAGSPGKLS